MLVTGCDRWCGRVSHPRLAGADQNAEAGADSLSGGPANCRRVQRPHRAHRCASGPSIGDHLVDFDVSIPQTTAPIGSLIGRCWDDRCGERRCRPASPARAIRSPLRDLPPGTVDRGVSDPPRVLKRRGRPAFPASLKIEEGGMSESKLAAATGRRALGQPAPGIDRQARPDDHDRSGAESSAISAASHLALKARTARRGTG